MAVTMSVPIWAENTLSLPLLPREAHVEMLAVGMETSPIPRWAYLDVVLLIVTILNGIIRALIPTSIFYGDGLLMSDGNIISQ